MAAVLQDGWGLITSLLIELNAHNKNESAPNIPRTPPPIFCECILHKIRYFRICPVPVTSGIHTIFYLRHVSIIWNVRTTSFLFHDIIRSTCGTNIKFCILTNTVPSTNPVYFHHFIICIIILRFRVFSEAWASCRPPPPGKKETVCDARHDDMPLIHMR